ncbi:MAG TPA: 16S rRNA (guanine(966)-N(2))-methyltransferase RsmD [Caulobacteraceae bacterium]|nr:16S rRNA (guanine(966)-N(2))-methyltransferase RsmD [Caulobacteraceae bacterium]
MRIAGGLYRGRSIGAPPGLATRPTADRARQAVFNMLEHAAWSPGLIAARVIDLFAGSGALGLEALSRGAASCLFVDTDERARAAIRDNLEALDPKGGLLGRSRVLRRDATTLGERSTAGVEPFGFAFLDPPYGQGYGESALAALGAGGWLEAGAICVLEEGARETDAIVAGFQTLDARRYGAARVQLLRWSPGAE